MAVRPGGPCAGQARRRLPTGAGLRGPVRVRGPGVPGPLPAADGTRRTRRRPRLDRAPPASRPRGRAGLRGAAPSGSTVSGGPGAVRGRDGGAGGDRGIALGARRHRRVAGFLAGPDRPGASPGSSGRRAPGCDRPAVGEAASRAVSRHGCGAPAASLARGAGEPGSDGSGRSSGGGAFPIGSGRGLVPGPKGRRSRLLSSREDRGRFFPVVPFEEAGAHPQWCAFPSTSLGVRWFRFRAARLRRSRAEAPPFHRVLSPRCDSGPNPAKRTKIGSRRPATTGRGEQARRRRRVAAGYAPSRMHLAFIESGGASYRSGRTRRRARSAPTVVRIAARAGERKTARADLEGIAPSQIATPERSAPRMRRRATGVHLAEGEPSTVRCAVHVDARPRFAAVSHDASGPVP
ncbi:MAG: hypothetical protein D6718_01680 [Acidobacteria bacterium]|nr:MAG: hypothetical protein D6718_01680 [Acidobacteriota bacterium]